MHHTAWSTDLENFLHSCPCSTLDVRELLAGHSEIPTCRPPNYPGWRREEDKWEVWWWSRKWGVIIDEAALKTYTHLTRVCKPPTGI